MATANREPWLAVIWSRAWPGLGQIYAGARRRGWAIAVVFSGLAIATLLAILGLAGLTIRAGILTGILLSLVRWWSWFDAYWITRRQNSAAFEAARQANKDPWKAVFWTTLFLGAGHLYIRRYGLGGVFGAIGVIGFAIPLAWLLLPFVAVHAYRATLDQVEHRQTQPRMGTIVLLVWVLPIVLAALPAFGLRTFVAEARYLPSGSMLPTLEMGDRIIINKLAYRRGEPQRGDLVLFTPTEALERQQFTDPFLKRVVGLPGEKVKVEEGKVLIDDQPLVEPYVLEPPAYEWGPEVVPEGEYFVLGDNRNNSYDSNYWGFVPQGNLVGKATQRFWPVARIGSIAATSGGSV